MANAYQEAVTLVTDKFAQSELAYGNAKTDLGNLILELKTWAKELGPIATDIDPPTVSPLPDMSSFTGVKPIKPDTSSNFPTDKPEAPPYQDIDFSGLQEPTVDELQIPVISIAVGDSEYSSTLLTAIQQRLQRIIEDGGRALPTEAEAEWFNRESERATQLHLDSIDRISAEWAKRSLPVPDDFLANQIITLEVEFKNKRLDVSRDIALKQYELADQNTRFALEKGITLEDVMTRLFSQIQDRMMQASKAYVEAQISFYNAQLQKYQVEAQVYSAIIDGRISKAKAIVELYVANVTAYRSQIEAEASRLDAIIRAFLGEVEAYKGEAQVFSSLSGLQIQAFDAQVRYVVAQTEILLKDAEIEIKNYEAVNGLTLEGLKAISAILAQQIAGAWAAVHASAGISGAGSTQTSESTSWQHIYEE